MIQIFNIYIVINKVKPNKRQVKCILTNTDFKNEITPPKSNLHSERL